MSGTARERLAGLLAAQDELSSSVQLRAKAPADLRLEVQGLGLVTLPVPADQARRLRGLGRPARFGRGEQTLTDPAVRDTWEIPTELVRVEWSGGHGLAAELDAVREELGLPEHCRLTAQLHSVLVYEKGQFFLPHQDSEKDDAMVATLVVTLPSAHRGGELVVHHLGEATVYRGAQDRVSLVAFYADCRHEVLPVTSGYRITLTYNLVLHGDSADRVPDQTTVDELSRQLSEHFTTPAHRLAFLLDHEYTERSLSWSLLKGTDTQRAAVLRAAVQAAGCEAVLALAEINEIWDVDEPPDDDDPGSDHHYELRDLLDSSIRLTRWTDPDGTTADDVSLPLADAEVCAATPSGDLQPYSQEYEGYMGNYGNTLDRWYRRAAVVVWPQDRRFANRAEGSPSWAMEEVSALARDGDPARARVAAATLAPLWEVVVRRQERPGRLLAAALPAAAAVQDASLAAMLLRPFMIESLGRGGLAALAELAGRYGPKWIDELLRTWFGGESAHRFVHGTSREQWLTSVPELCAALVAEGDAGVATAHRLLELAWGSLSTLIGSAAASRSPTASQQRLVVLGVPLAALLTAITASQATDLRDRLVAYCRQHGDTVSSCVVAALRSAAATVPAQTQPDDALARLAAEQVAVLRARLARPVRAADDWSIELVGGCVCELCGHLRPFLADPARRTLEWPLAEGGRSHVHSRLDQAELPVTHRTRREGRPFTLVLTKTAQLFEREAGQRGRDQADLDWLSTRLPLDQR